MRFHERLRVVRVVLRELSRQPQRRGELMKRAVTRGASYCSFNFVFAYLLSEGFVEKTGLELHAPFRITERGLRFLEAM